VRIASKIALMKILIVLLSFWCGFCYNLLEVPKFPQQFSLQIDDEANGRFWWDGINLRGRMDYSGIGDPETGSDIYFCRDGTYYNYAVHYENLKTIECHLRTSNNCTAIAQDIQNWGSIRQILGGINENASSNGPIDCNDPLLNDEARGMKGDNGNCTKWTNSLSGECVNPSTDFERWIVQYLQSSGNASEHGYLPRAYHIRGHTMRKSVGCVGFETWTYYHGFNIGSPSPSVIEWHTDQLEKEGLCSPVNKRGSAQDEKETAWKQKTAIFQATIQDR